MTFLVECNNLSLKKLTWVSGGCKLIIFVRSKRLLGFICGVQGLFASSVNSYMVIFLIFLYSLGE